MAKLCPMRIHGKLMCVKLKDAPLSNKIEKFEIETGNMDLVEARPLHNGRRSRDGRSLIRILTVKV